MNTKSKNLWIVTEKKAGEGQLDGSGYRGDLWIAYLRGDRTRWKSASSQSEAIRKLHVSLGIDPDTNPCVCSICGGWGGIHGLPCTSVANLIK